MKQAPWQTAAQTLGANPITISLVEQTPPLQYTSLQEVAEKFSEVTLLRPARSKPSATSPLERRIKARARQKLMHPEQRAAHEATQPAPINASTVVKVETAQDIASSDSREGIRKRLADRQTYRSAGDPLMLDDGGPLLKSGGLCQEGNRPKWRNKMDNPQGLQDQREYKIRRVGAGIESSGDAIVGNSAVPKTAAVGKHSSVEIEIGENRGRQGKGALDTRLQEAQVGIEESIRIRRERIQNSAVAISNESVAWGHSFAVGTHTESEIHSDIPVAQHVEEFVQSMIGEASHQADSDICSSARVESASASESAATTTKATHADVPEPTELEGGMPHKHTIPTTHATPTTHTIHTGACGQPHAEQNKKTENRTSRRRMESGDMEQPEEPEHRAKRILDVATKVDKLVLDYLGTTILKITGSDGNSSEVEVSLHGVKNKWQEQEQEQEQGSKYKYLNPQTNSSDWNNDTDPALEWQVAEFLKEMFVSNVD
jgi:hypothetical protein